MNASARGLTEVIEDARRRDRIGDRVHLGIAMWTMACIPTGTTPAAITSGVLTGYAVLRLWATWRAYLFTGRHAITWILLAWLGWHALSLTWSVDIREGVDELGIFRLHLPLILGLWPVLDRARWLLWSLAIGAAITIAAQTLQLAGLNFGWYDPIVPDRYPGYHHPSGTAFFEMVVGGLALGVTLGATSNVRRGLAGLTALGCAFGILLTGSRGLWLATVVSWPITVMVAASAVGWGSARHRRITLISTVVVFVLGSLAAFSFEASRTRIDDAATQARAALIEGDARSSVGARLVQFRHAWMLFREHPVRGVGAGSWFPEACRVAGRPENPNDVAVAAEDRVPVLPHAHSSPMHVLATTGAPGALIMLAFWVVLVRTAWRVRRVRTPVDGALAAGPGVVVAMGLASIVDSHHLATAGTTTVMALAAMMMYFELVHDSGMDPDDGPDTTLPIPDAQASS